MGLIDGFLFWLGKELAEFALVLAILTLFGLGVGFCLLLEKLGRKRR